MRIRLLAALLALSTPGLAAEPAYLDDRSSAEALVRSLYNAVNRKEFARAYSYFTTPPADTLDAYAEGYASTASVEVLTGAVGEEGAAGSIFYQVPVAIRAESAGGGTSVFAGCYVVRLASPQIQTEPFVPMSIESGKLGVAQEPLEDAVPERCGDGPPPPPRDRRPRPPPPAAGPGRFRRAGCRAAGPRHNSPQARGNVAFPGGRRGSSRGRCWQGQRPPVPDRESGTRDHNARRSAPRATACRVGPGRSGA